MLSVFSPSNSALSEQNRVTDNKFTNNLFSIVSVKVLVFGCIEFLDHIWTIDNYSSICCSEVNEAFWKLGPKIIMPILN